MNIIFASSNPHLPQTFGGVETNTHELALSLQRRGHNVAVLTTLALVDTFGLTRHASNLVRNKKVWRDNDLGYVTYRAREPWNVVDAIQNYDVAIMTNGHMVDFARAFRRKGTKTVAYLHGVTEFLDWRTTVMHHSDASFDDFWALSKFTADRFKQTVGLDSLVIRPIFRETIYKTAISGRHVTFINPVSQKGIDRAIEIAELCPDIPFVFVRGWPLGRSALRKLNTRLKPLPNVTLRPSTYDVKSIHRHTKIMLVPTSLEWEETWGRVVSEAQINGIPVVASNHGALPESVGDGGILMDYRAPAKAWASEVRRLWTDPAHFSALSNRALSHSRRIELDPDSLVAILEQRLRTPDGPSAI